MNHRVSRDFRLTPLLSVSVWYIIVTMLFRCPKSLDDLSDDSPKLCKPYLTVQSHAAPYVEPYYNTYLAPHVEKAQPYIDRFNDQIYTPSAEFVKNTYQTYGAPRVAQTQEFALAEWEKTLKPRLQLAQGQAKAQYDAALAPHVDKLSAAASPYYDQASSIVGETYNSKVVPAYEVVLPHAQNAYEQGRHYAVDVGYPYARWGASSLGNFLFRQVWPQLRILYGDNVEPQLMRIKERLGRYRDGKKLEAVVESMVSSASSSSAASSASFVSSSVAASAEAHKSASTTASSLSDAESKAAKREDVQEKVTKDLRTWQEKFAKAADKGAEDLEERVKEITDHQIESQAHGVGQAFLIQLEETAESKLKDLKSHIKSAVEALPEDANEDDIEAAYGGLMGEVRAAGQAIKEKAQAIRSWKQSYDRETIHLVTSATESTLEVIDHIRDLGLQEIGMRWAWMEGVTYKDWSKYHSLKKTFDEWRKEVQGVAYEHAGFKSAREEGAKIEETGMAVAEEAAKELVRLKDVARFKLYTHDSSDDFDSTVIPPEAIQAARKVKEAIKDAISDASEAVAGTSQGTMESVASVASEQVEDASSKISENIIGTEPGVAEQAATKASEAILGTQDATDSISSVASSKASEASSSAGEAAQSVVSAAKLKKDQASQAVLGSPAPPHESIASKASEAIIGSETPIYESIASQASEAVVGSETPAYESLASKASEAVVGSSTPVAESVASEASSSTESLASEASSSIDSASSAVSEAGADATESVKKVWGGAMAQVIVEAKQIIFEDEIDDSDDDTYSEKIQSMVSEAGDRAAELTQAISEAILKPTSTQGSVESATSLASEQYAKAMAAASSVLYGPEQGSAESIASAASDKYAQAVTAASYAIYGTPAPVIESLRAQASAQYDSAFKLAKEQYEEAKAAVSAKISGTPKPAHEEALSSINDAYSSSIAAASAKLQDALKYTDSVKSYAAGPTQGAWESVSSIASSRLQEGLNSASAQ